MALLMSRTTKRIDFANKAHTFRSNARPHPHCDLKLATWLKQHVKNSYVLSSSNGYGVGLGPSKYKRKSATDILNVPKFGG